MLLLYESLKSDGTREQVLVSEQGGTLLVHVGSEEPIELPMLALERVMERYGKPLADDVSLEGPRVELGAGCALHRIRHRGFYDVIARDFVVWVAPGREPLAELASGISAALVHLARAVAGPSSSSEVALGGVPSSVPTRAAHKRVG